MSTIKISLAGFALATFMMLPAYAQDKLFVYPSAQQSSDQQAQDRYDCHMWAVEQSRFDPSTALVIVKKPVRVKVGPNESAGATAKGAIAGAVVGGLIGARGHDTAEGVVIGATVGAAVGTTVEQDGKAKARDEARVQARSKAQLSEDKIAEQNRMRADYRRAFASCMEGREYTVR